MPDPSTVRMPSAERAPLAVEQDEQEKKNEHRPSARPEVSVVPPSEEPGSRETPTVPAATSPAPVVIAQKTKLQKDVESVLEDGLGDIYLSLKPAQQQQFRVEGEKTAIKIAALLKKATTTILDIVKAIRSWLALIPGVNRFFLEQEAKIRAEKMMELRPNDHE